jgi:hypothetical protein
VSGSSITGAKSTLNVSAATLITTAANPVGSRIARVSVTTAGSGAGSLYDSATVAGAAAANLIATIPNAVGVITIDFPVTAGIVVVPGAGQVVSVSYDG